MEGSLFALTWSCAGISSQYTLLLYCCSNYHKLSGLAQHRFIIWPSEGQKSKTSHNGAPVNISAVLFLSEGVQQISFLAYRSHPHSLAGGFFITSLWALLPASDLFSLAQTLLVLSHQDPYNYIGITQIIQDNIRSAPDSEFSHICQDCCVKEHVRSHFFLTPGIRM